MLVNLNKAITYSDCLWSLVKVFPLTKLPSLALLWRQCGFQVAFQP